MKRLAIFALLLFSTSTFAQHIPASATLPSTEPNPVYPSTIQTTKTVKAGGDYAGTSAGLQSALTDAIANRATWGSTGAIEIRLDPAVTFSKTNAPWTINSCGGATTELIIRTDSNSMPAQGTRITAADYANMPIIESTGTDIVVMVIGSPAVNGTVQACNIRLMGLRVRKDSGYSLAFWVVQVGDGDSTHDQDTSAETPSGIWIDRSFVGCDDAAQTCAKGVVFSAKNGGMTDSICTGLKSATNPDTNCLYSQNTPGNLLFKNNEMSSAGEPVAFGGSGQPIGGEQYNPSDVTFQRNLFRMDAGCPSLWGCKNLFELKIGVRFLIEGNIFQFSRLDAQSGQGITLKSTNSNQNRPWAETGHITIRYNIQRDLEGYCLLLQGFDGSPGESTFGNVYLHHVTFHDNLCDGASNGAALIGVAGEMSTRPCTYATGCPAAANQVPASYYLNHNTFIASARVNGSLDSGWSMDGSVNTPLTRCSSDFGFHNNAIALWREGGTATNSAGLVHCVIDGVENGATDASKWSHDYNSFWTNLLLNATAESITTPNLSNKPMATNPIGRSADQCSQFVSCTAGNIGTGANNYTLAAGSPGKGTAFDAAARTAAGLSTDVGADIAKVNEKTCGSLVGNWTACAGGKPSVPRGRPVPR